jgi:hypothetical protein
VSAQHNLNIDILIGLDQYTPPRNRNIWIMHVLFVYINKPGMPSN